MLEVKHIIRSARGQKSQAKFATIVGKSQGLISKYEQGTVSPPADTIDKCIKILYMNKGSDEASTALLAKRIKLELGDNKLAYVRKTIETILDGVQAARK